MPHIRIIFLTILTALLSFSQLVSATNTMSDEQITGVKRRSVETAEMRTQLQKSAVLLARYEIQAKKLVKMTEAGADSVTISKHAALLMDLSETVIDSARFRLPQCDEYLSKSMTLRDILKTISHAKLETDFHHDGALPPAPAECYHAKDLFVHPATVMVLTRDDPALADATKNSIKAEIREVLAHTELVRQLVLY